MIGMLLTLISAFAAAQADAQVVRDIQSSHVDANVPDSADFEEFLRRDLAEYFSAAVEYEALRRGATQSGVSYPKYYLWVRIAGGKNPQDRGAVRIAAIEKKRFEVTDFVSEEAIRKEPHKIYAVFPAAVCETIKTKLNR